MTRRTAGSPLHRALPALAAASLLALAAVGCGDDNGETAPGTETGATTGTATDGAAQGEIVDATELRACLKDAGSDTGPAASDAVVASYAREATEAGGESFVIQEPIAQVIVFPDRVDLAEAEEELLGAAARNGIRANSMQADSYGNVVIVYFASGGADKTAVTDCLGAEADAVPGLELPYVPSDELAPGVAPQ
jgi:hypothetical protein